MRGRLLPLLAVAIAVRTGQAQSSWASVPADPAAGRIETLVVPSVPGEESIRLLGGAAPAQPSPDEAGHVVSVDIGIQAERSPAFGSVAGPKGSPIPANAIWPNPDGKITELVIGNEGDAAKAGIRNPWVVRVCSPSAGHESTFLCGGVIAGGPGGPVTLLNGHIMACGSTVWGFRVAQIAPGAAVIELHGVSYVLPVGRRVVIQTAGD